MPKLIDVVPDLSQELMHGLDGAAECHQQWRVVCRLPGAAQPRRYAEALTYQEVSLLCHRSRR